MTVTKQPQRKRVTNKKGAVKLSPSENIPTNMEDLTQLLHFRPKEGRIWLQDQRMILLHAEAFTNLRQEMINSLGIENTRGILTRIGYFSGSRDAEFARNLRGSSETPSDIWDAGAQLHALEGVVLPEPIRWEMDSSTGHCYLEFYWKNCFEVEGHINAYGLNSDPSCWMEIGYASGFLSACMGKRILVREVECRSNGFNQCRAIAKPVAEWEDNEEDLKYFAPNVISSLVASPTLQASFIPTATLYEGAQNKLTFVTNSTIGASAGFNTVMHKIRRVAPTNAAVLFLGESGVGKSMFARELYRSSKRSNTSFIEVNCAAIPEQLIESELFGVERGAYSGAIESRAGRFEIANKGCLFLDEIATLSLTAQGKLLRVLQSGEMERLGSTKTITVDVRLIAATNENLAAAVKEGRFREDLFYRINVFPIAIPPLRDRKDDLPVLLEYCIEKFSARHDKHISGITPRALQILLGYQWPGNIRELENVIERGIIFADEGASLDVHHLFSVDETFDSNDLIGLSVMGSLVEKNISMEHESDELPIMENIDIWAKRAVNTHDIDLSRIEDALVKAAVDKARGNISKAATLLGLSRHQLDYRFKKMGEL